MSRIRTEISQVQFQVDARKANASMEALQNTAKELNDKIAEIERNIKELGNVAPDNAALLKFQKSLREYNRDLKDVTRAQNELIKGVKAADELFRHARLGTIEQMSLKGIKAGQRGLQQRMQNLNPSDAEDVKTMRAYNAVIEEGDIVMKRFTTDAAHMVSAIKEGSEVSARAMRQTRDGLKDLVDITPRGTAEWHEARQQLDFMEQSLIAVAAAERKAKGEIVDADDARRVAIQLSREGAEAAARAREEADREIAASRESIEQIKARKEEAQKEIKTIQEKIAASEILIKSQEGIVKMTEKELAKSQNTGLTAILDEQQQKLDKLNREQAENITLLHEQEATVAKLDKAINAEAQKIADNEVRKAQAETHTIEKTEEAIKVLTQRNKVIEHGSEEWQQNTREIQKLTQELDRMKGQAALQMMTDRMAKVPELSEAALAETKKFWEAMAAGADRGSRELTDYENHLKSIAEEERKRSTESLVSKTTRLDNTARYSEAEVHEAIEAGKQLIQTYKVGSDEATALAKKIVAAEEYVKQYGVEAERAAMREAKAIEEANRKRKEQDELMLQQLTQGTALSESALKAQENYWRRLIDDPKTAAASIDNYKTMLEEVIALQQKQAKTTRTQQADRLLRRGYLTMSEDEIRKSIAAARELQQTLSPTEGHYKTISKVIVEAEEHLKKYGIEAVRAAVREQKAIEEANRKRQEQNDLMRQQFQTMVDGMKKGTAPSETALKAQLNYWQRLIDDPKTAADSLEEYRLQLAEVQKMQDAMVRINGEAALGWFREERDKDASRNDVKEMSDKLKAFRNTLPKESEAATIREIDEYLQRAGVSAEKAADEMMDLDRALTLADTAGKRNFVASPQEIRMATEAIEKHRDEIIATIKAKRDSGEATAAEEKELADLAKKLRDLKFEQDNFNMSQDKMQMLMRTPTNAVNLEELRTAIKRADAQLRRMEGSLGKNSEEYKEFAKQVKEAKIVLGKMEGQSKATASSFEKAWSRLKTYVGLYVGASVAMQKITSMMGDLMTLSDKMGEVMKTTGFTADEVGRLSTNLKKLDTRTDLTGLMELSAKAGQLGLKSMEDVEGFAEAANKMLVALPEMGAEGATEMLKVALATGEIDKIGRQMREGLIEGSSATAVAMEKVGSTIDRLRATTAATAPAITDFVKRVGAVGAQSGISIDQVAALGTTVDALGMRVEMSATALSRMIPAIRNNAFSVAKAIGVTPETLRELFETGRGMEAILLIFQHIKDSGKDADSIEKLLGMAGMQEVMKELNQQGARAGIVFAGLSQNVDELRKNLSTAAQAYEENVAIQQEYNKMNETTAAKWARLKNQIEEIFVGDQAQRWLGTIIDLLRWAADAVSDNSRKFLVLITILGTYRLGLGEALKALGSYMLNLGTTAKSVAKWFAGLNAANLWGAAIAGAVAAGAALYDWANRLKESAREAARFEAELMKEQGKVESLTNSIGKARVATEEAEKEVKEAKVALDAAKKATDGSRESTDRLAKAEARLVSAEEKRHRAMSEQKRLLEQFNNEYGKYLGFMLSEVASELELAQARELANDKLRETITLKRKEAALTRVEKDMGEDRDDAYSDLWDLVRRKSTVTDKNGKEVADPEKAARVMTALTKAANNGSDKDAFRESAKQIFQKNGIGNADVLLKWATDYWEHVAKIRKKNQQIEEEFAGEEAANRQQAQQDLKRQYDSAVANYEKLQQDYAKATGDARKQAAANLLKQMDSINEMVDNAGNYYEMADEEEKKSYNDFIKNGDERTKGMMAQRDQLLKEAGDAYKPRATVGGGTTTGTTGNPWGTPLGAESTDWANMTADQLVNRRKQMNEFVRSIQTDSDVQAVLKEDTALKKAIESGMSSDMRTVIEWYNTERLKIQDELHARHLTNTGDWMDPKRARARKKRFEDELRAYLEELDAYYTERKTRIEEAGTDEGLTEAEVRNRTLANEMEWRQRRAELQKLYADKTGEVAEQEQQAIYSLIAERTGDTDTFIKKSIEKTVAFAYQVRAMNDQGAKEYRKWMANLGLGWERDLNKMQAAVTQQMRAIQNIIDKERPFNGITKNLRENLVTMGILTADMTRERNRLMQENADMTEFNERQAAEEVRRTAFMLGEAESAYTTTIEAVMRRMADAGMTAWADELQKSPKMQEGLMAQLRQTYDEVQEAIKKEASLLKKEAEIMWNNILMPDNKTTMKDAADRAVAQLSLDESRVSRANSLIGAGTQSQRVADRLAIKQMQIELTMQEHYYNLMKKRGEAAVRALKEQARAAQQRGDTEEATRKTLDAQHAEQALNLATAKEETELAKQREEIIARTEESQNRLYTQLREWVDLLSSSMQSMFEAGHAGDAEYYNNLATLNLTGKGGPGAGTYVVIDNAGTKDAKAHYEHLDEREALEREHEIEIQNARAEALRKIMDDMNARMNDQITDWMNAFLQNQSINANTTAIDANTIAIEGLTQQLSEGIHIRQDGASDGSGLASNEAANHPTAPDGATAIEPTGDADPVLHYERVAQASTEARETVIRNQNDMAQNGAATCEKMTTGAQSAFAKMTQAANLYGIAYQAMSNENMSTAQKFEMIALQSAGQAAISMLTTDLAKGEAENTVRLPGILGKLLGEMPYPAAIATFAIVTGLLGGLMGMAVSRVAKSKSEIAQATGASAGASAGKLTTGMLTYAEGNVNEFTDPSSLTVGRSYDVDGADGNTYHARYMGKNPRTHLTNGPEFHLVGEAGQEAIIDAKTTRQIRMDDNGIWRSIQTLYNGGRLRHTTRRGRGVSAFAEGNIDELQEYSDDMALAEESSSQNVALMAGLQASIDRQSELLERALRDGIKGVFDVYGRNGLIDSYDRGKKTMTRYGEKY